MKTFTLVPIGGLGNRINSICSAIVYCQQQQRLLKIYWFKDPTLNCPVKDLFSLDPRLKNVELIDGNFWDYYKIDRPRRRNIWLPYVYQKHAFDKRILDKDVYKVVSSKEISDFGNLEMYEHIYMVNYWRFWTHPEMWSVLKVNSSIQKEVDHLSSQLKTKRRIGIHFRGTDNTYSRDIPIECFIEKIDGEIKEFGEHVSFYLASDEINIKERLKGRYKNRIFMMDKPVCRNSKQGIIDAFVEMNVLAQMDKIYASQRSSFSELAHLLSNNEFEELK